MQAKAARHQPRRQCSGFRGSGLWRSRRRRDLKALQSAAKFADDDIRRRVTMNRAVLSLGKDQLKTLEDLNGTPPEALVNLGILYEQAGRPKDAYEAWTKAKARGVNAKDLQKWIDNKKRFYGF